MGRKRMSGRGVQKLPKKMLCTSFVDDPWVIKVIRCYITGYHLFIFFLSNHLSALIYLIRSIQSNFLHLQSYMNRLSRMLARKFVLVKPFEGLPKLTDFQIVEETLSTELNDGGMRLTITRIFLEHFLEMIATRDELSFRDFGESRMVDCRSVHETAKRGEYENRRSIYRRSSGAVGDL